VGLVAIAAMLTGCFAGSALARPTAPRLTPTTAIQPRCAIPPAWARAGAKRQVLLVTASRTRATVVACSLSHGRYVRTLGPFAARVGIHGVAAKRGREAKREGDGRTPAGVFPLRSGFGTEGDPGLRLGWFDAGRRDVWVDDPASSRYNTHQKRPVHGRWRSAEQLRMAAYSYAQVIGYNESRIPGAGSAIFLHVGTGGPTVGCVSLSATHLRAVMRWERTGVVIAIT
jgi:L,D-peptidoglycan transpeptidase YkuD (ErfK/YbiS/YcfS/YnhG family)